MEDNLDRVYDENSSWYDRVKQHGSCLVNLLLQYWLFSAVVVYLLWYVVRLVLCDIHTLGHGDSTL